MMVYDLGGRADISYPPSGMVAHLVIPAKHVSIVDDERAPEAEAPCDTIDDHSLAGMSVLLVEDQSLIALDTEDILRRLGAKDVRLSPDAPHAVSTLQSFRPDTAILDFNLGDTTSEAVADQLVAMGVPFAFATGDGDSVMIPRHLRSVPVVRKPASVASVSAQLAEARRIAAQG